MKFLGCFQDREEFVQKYVFKNEKGILEISHIHTKRDRDIYCVPSMYMCFLGCKFCHITSEGLKGKSIPVTSGELLEALERIPRTKPDRHISVMGMGDPALNQDLILDLSKTDKVISLSTIFPIKLVNIPENVKIHFSLHHPVDEERKKIIPANCLSVEKALTYLKFEHQGKSEIHYTLIKGINDSEEALFKMKDLCCRYNIPVKFLHFNETADFKRTSQEAIDHWMNSLSLLTDVEFYIPPGRNIGSSCGEFTKHFYNDDALQSEEYKEYERKYRIL